MRLLTLFATAALYLSVAGAAVLQENNNAPVKTMAGWDWVDCGDETDPVELKSITVSPDPPKPGEDLLVTVNAVVKDEVEDGAYADVLVKIGVIKLLEKQFDMCEEARKANVTELACPVSEGEYTITQKAALPKEIPRAKFVVEVRAYTVDDENLACADIMVDFRPKFPYIGW